MSAIEIIPLSAIGEVRPGEDLVATLASAVTSADRRMLGHTDNATMCLRVRSAVLVSNAPRERLSRHRQMTGLAGGAIKAVKQQ